LKRKKIEDSKINLNIENIKCFRGENMKVVILCGGLGTRLMEETKDIPKPMVQIGGKPILWHIMKIYSHYGYNDFIICVGYKGEVIKEYFKNYFLNNSDFTVDIGDNKIEIVKKCSESWKVTIIDTGANTLTGGRIKRIKEYIKNETFMLTYGDGVSDVNIKELVEFHKKNKHLATVTAVIPEGRYGSLKIEGDIVTEFAEKKDNDNKRINGGFFVLEPKVIDYISGDLIMWEKEPLEALSEEGQLDAYPHDGFWMAMDKLSDKKRLDDMWTSGKAPWKIWKDELK